MKTQEELWNQKAQTFPRFKLNDNDTLEILEFFNQKGVSFKDKEILEIGCGNGRFTLQLALEARKIIACDISTKMLEALKEDSEKYHYKNIQTILGDFSGISFPKAEIAFASMTPALARKEDFLKVFELFRECFCYVGWGRIPKDWVITRALEIHNLPSKNPIGLPEVMQWIKPKHFKYLKTEYRVDISIKEAYEKISWHIAMQGGSADKGLISGLLEPLCKGGRISYTAEKEVGVALFV